METKRYPPIFQSVPADEFTDREEIIKLVGVVPWLVNRGGFTQGAIEAIQEHGIYYSGAAEINELLRMFGIERLLPEGSEAEQWT
jgi:hypothetical protein